jgi:hypothetical protein
MKKFKIYTCLLIIVLCLGTCVYRCTKKNNQYALLRKSPFTIKAIIINEKNFYPNHPVTHEFAYSYQFTLNDKTYKASSLNSKLKIGDTIIVRYLKSDPSLNLPVDIKQH